MNILITSAGRRVSLIKAFKESSVQLKTKSKIFITDLNTERSPAAYFADECFNIGYFKEFSQREIQVIGNGENIFYGFETRLDKTYPLRPLTFQGFKRWVENKYPGANWPNVHKSKQRTNIPAIETALAKRIPNLAHLNRWVSSTRFGKITNVSEFFQMTWKEREPLENFLHALESYAERSDCDIEN